MIEFDCVHKAFAGKPVLRGLSFKVEPKQVVFLVGKSGAGKSVVLRHAVGLVKPDSGQIRIDGLPIAGLGEEALREVRRRCGMVFQFPALLDSLTVVENILLSLEQESGQPADRALAEAQMRRVGLSEEYLDRMPTDLSFGVQKRVSLARALTLEPEALLFDEPTTGLDPVATREVHSLIQHLSRSLGLAALLVSHDIEGALEFADQILLLEQGRISDCGTPAVFRRSSHPLTAEFVRGI